MKQPSLTQVCRQRGAVSILAALLIMFMVAAAVTGVVKVSGSSVFDSARQEDQTAALFIAESGLERALAVIRYKANLSTYKGKDCTDLKGETITLGRGQFTYTDAKSYADTDGNGTPEETESCGDGFSAQCTKCAITVTSTVGSSSRELRADMVATTANGTASQTNSSCIHTNCDADKKAALTLKVQTSPAFVFAHLLNNSTTNWGGANVGNICFSKNMDDSSTGTCTMPWAITGNYYNNPASMGVYATVTKSGNWTVTQDLTVNPPGSGTNNSIDTRRNFSFVGAIFYGADIGIIGSSFAKNPAGLDGVSDTSCASGVPVTEPRTQPRPQTACNPSDYFNAYLPYSGTNNIWTCTSGTASNNSPYWVTTTNWSNAAQADTLIAGFGGKPYHREGTNPAPDYCDQSVDTGETYPRCTNRISEIKVNAHPMYKQIQVVNDKLSDKKDYQYSQLWYTYNKGFESTAATANSGDATFTGGVGAQVQACIGSGYSAAVPGGTLSTCPSGYTRQCSGGTPQCRRNNNPTTNLTCTSGTPACSTSGGGSNYRCDPVPAQCTGSGNNLYVTSVTGGGIPLRNGDTITVGGSARTISGVSSTNPGGASTTPYTISGAAASVASPTNYTVSSRVLRVSNVVAGSIVDGATITSTAGVPGNPTVSYPTAAAYPSGTGGTMATAANSTAGNANIDFILTGTGYPTAIANGADQPNLHTGDVKKITLTGTLPASAPAVGTALGAVGGTGQFSPSGFMGNISGITLTITGQGTVRQYNGSTTSTDYNFTYPPTLGAGDALFGGAPAGARDIATGGVLPDTHIMSCSSSTQCTVSRSHNNTGTIFIMARPAVCGTDVGCPAPTATSFYVSRPPDTPLADAKICGGLCPVLLPSNLTNSDGDKHTPGSVNFTGIYKYDDWSGGFACLKGTIPENISSITTILARTLNWSEVVR